MAASDAQSMSGEAILLQDFVETFKLPKISEVVGGKGLSGAPFSAGDSLMLRTLAVESVGLRFYDADAGSRREVRVPVDNNFKFHVVQDYNSATPKVYPTVANLLSDCPTVFKANTEVTTRNGRTLQRGSVLNFVRKTRSLTDRCVFLECRDSAGTHHLLPLSSRGDFTIVHDPSSYTLQEIISLGAVERILRLSNENKKFAVANDGSQHVGDDFARHLPVYDNVQNKDAALSRITGLPLTFKGNIYMQRPELFLLSSPANDTGVRWKIALDSNLYFLVPEEERSVDYQEPIKPDLVLKEFVEEFEQDFPVIARLGSCKELQNKFKEYLSDGMEVLVHRVDKVEKILCNISGDKFCVSDRVKGRLRKSLMRFRSLSELISQGLNQEEVAIKMMEDIASDVPEPFSLKAGDVIIFKNFNVSTVNIKVGKKSYEKCQVILCEKVLEDETKQKLQLPLDFEADFIQLPRPGEESGFDINVVLSKSINLPLTVDFIPTTITETCLLPTDCEITIENVVIDSLVVISPLPHRENRESGLSARLKFCLLLPLRSDVTLRLEEKLQFPSNYFIFPRRHKWIEELEVERLSDGEYGYMTKYNDSAYEDYAFRQSFSECNINDYVSGKNSKKKSKKLKKKNRSVTELELDKIDLQKVASSPGRLTSGSETDLTLHATKINTRADDENIYETFDPGKKRRERRKSDTSLKSRIKRRVSKIF